MRAVRAHTCGWVQRSPESCCVLQRARTTVLDLELDPWAKSFLGYTPYRLVCGRRDRMHSTRRALRVLACARQALSPHRRLHACSHTPETSWTSGHATIWAAMRRTPVTGAALTSSAASQKRERLLVALATASPAKRRCGLGGARVRSGGFESGPACIFVKAKCVLGGRSRRTRKCGTGCWESLRRRSPGSRAASVMFAS